MLKKHQSILFIGDSITDCGRNRPVGTPGGLGTGYVQVLHGMLYALRPDLAPYLLNTGISGNTVRHLKERWTTDVLELKPDWLSLMIGINDVWRQFDWPQRKDGVPIREYEATLRALLGKTRPRLKGLVLMTPFFIEPNTREPMRAMMDRYGAVAKKLAKEFDAVSVDTQAAYDAAMKELHPLQIAGDRVHPGIGGHSMLAVAWLRAMGLLK
jgi:lysophospholipase L1-like esterase